MLRTWHFVPSDQERFYNRISDLPPCAIIFDLEDGISEANISIGVNLINQWIDKLKNKHIYVRTDRTDVLENISAKARSRVVLPKVQSAEQIKKIAGMAGVIEVLPLIEDLGMMLNLKEITSIDCVQSIGIGFEDMHANYAEDPGEAKKFWDFVLCSFCMQARAWNKRPIASVFTDNSETEDGLMEDCVQKKQLGFSGMFSIHPDQIEMINSCFNVRPSQVAWAEDYLTQWQGNRAEGYFRLKDQIYSKPKAIKAQKILDAFHGGLS